MAPQIQTSKSCRIRVALTGSDYLERERGWFSNAIRVPGARTVALLIKQERISAEEFPSRGIVIDYGTGFVRWQDSDRQMHAELEVDLTSKLVSFKALITTILAAIVTIVSSHGPQLLELIRHPVAPSAKVRAVRVGFTPYATGTDKEFAMKKSAEVAAPANQALEHLGVNNMVFGVFSPSTSEKGYAGIFDSLKSGDATIAFVSAFTYVSLLRNTGERENYVPIGHKVHNNKRVYWSNLVSPKRCFKSNDIEEMVQKVETGEAQLVLGTEHLSTSTVRVPLAFFLERGVALRPDPATAGRTYLRKSRAEVRSILKDRSELGDCVVAALSNHDLEEFSECEMTGLRYSPIPVQMPTDVVVAAKEPWEAIPRADQLSIKKALEEAGVMGGWGDEDDNAFTVFGNYIGSAIVVRRDENQWIATLPDGNPQLDILRISRGVSTVGSVLPVRVVRFVSNCGDDHTFCTNEDVLGRGTITRLREGSDGMLARLTVDGDLGKRDLTGAHLVPVK